MTDLAQEAVGAAVAVVVEDDLLPRAHEAGDGREGGHAGAERERLVPLFELADLIDETDEVRGEVRRDNVGGEAED